MVSNSISNQHPAAPATVPRRRAVLQELVEVASVHVNSGLNDFTARLVAALLDASQACSDAKAANAFFAAGNLLKNNAYPFYHLASIAVRKALQDAVDGLFDAGIDGVARIFDAASGDDRDTGLDSRPQTRPDARLHAGQYQPTQQPVELMLVPFADIENRLLLERAARPLEAADVALLSAITAHVATLAGREQLAPGDNPFRPTLLLGALDCAWREFAPDVALHGLMLQLMQDGLVPDMKPALQAVERACIAAGLPPQRPKPLPIHRSRSRPAPAGAALANPALVQQLRQLFDRPAEAGAGPGNRSDPADLHRWPHATAAASQPPAISPALSAYLSNLQARTRHTPTASSATCGDDATAGDTGATASMANRGLAPTLPDPATGEAAASRFMPTGAPALAAAARQADGAIAGQAARRDAAPTGMPECSLRALRDQVPAGALTRADETTLDVMTRIFEAVFRDPDIPAEMKELIGYLQIPVLKAALLDKEFFFEDAHPARRLISLLTRSSVGWDKSRGRADPLYRAIEQNVNRAQLFDAEIAVFADVVASLEAFLAEDDARADEAIAAPIVQALRQEKRREATRAAVGDVAERIATGDVAPFVETFLEDRWVPVLAMAYGVREEKPQLLASAIRTMDDLLWSVRPKLTAPERRELVEKLPALLTTLNKWLDIVKWNDADRLQFFADLAECHASIVRAPLELSPQRQLELAVEAARLAAERRQQKKAAPVQEPARDMHAEQVAALERGMWFEFTQPDAGVRRVKLAWVSPLRSLYIFTTIHREEAFSLSAENLAENFRRQQVRIVDTDGFVDRALADVLGATQETVFAPAAETVAGG